MDDMRTGPNAADEDVTTGSPLYYLNGRRIIKTPSSVLISSSRWLNEPRIREWVANENLRRNGDDYPLLFGFPQAIQAIDDTRDDDKIEDLIRAERKTNKALDRWFEERFISTYTKANLADNPPGSVGRLLFEHMDKLGLETELDPRILANPDWKPERDIEYFNLRSGQTHDFDHLLGEVGFDVISEIFPTGLRTGNVFTHVSPELAGQLLTVNTFTIFPWFMRCQLHYPAAWPSMWHNLSHGYEVGQASEPLFMARYEEVLHLTPAQAREKLGMRGWKGPHNSEAASLVFGEGRLII